MDASRIEEVKAPQHDGTPRARVHGHHFCYYCNFPLARAAHGRPFATPIKYGICEFPIIALLVEGVEFGGQLFVAHVLHIN